MCNETMTGWDLASVAKVHLQQMDDARTKGDTDLAETEFEKAWSLMTQARDAFLEEIREEYRRDTEE
jgi:hypothetical protein